MGIYLPNLKMPTEGWHKVIKIFSDGTVVNHYDGVELGKAVPVPKHGDLIDRDALKPYMLNEHYKHRLVFDADEVANAPAIIPTSEEGE